MQSILDKARTLMAASCAPLKYWDHALLTAAYLIMRSPNSMNDKTPHEILRGEPPDVSHLVHFYAPGVYHLTKEERKDTWDFKAHKCRMLGYDEWCKNTYVIVTIPEGRIISRKDCLFDESLRGYNIPLLMDQDVETETRLINFESKDPEESDDKLIGDNVAPYFLSRRIPGATGPRRR